ncbi:hypothetical protein [Methylobacterium crusticola]|nr:hypothetical protein [Methylobacterium crusticola]
MKQDSIPSGEAARERAMPALGADAQRRLGLKLRSLYERTIDGLPIPLEQVELLLRLRHRERDAQRAR